MPKIKTNPQIEIALRNFAQKMMDDPNSFSQEDGRIMDRALRSCTGVSDIDVIWVRWSFIGEQQGWITDSELKFKNGRYYYE